MPPTPSLQPPIPSANDFAICHKPLLVPITPEDSNAPSYVTDDVQLHCNHHFHYSCLLDYCVSSPEGRTRCALRRQSVLNARGEFMVTIKIEDESVEGMNIGEDVERVLYYQANPEAERTMGFLAFMSQMDFEEAELYLKGEDGDGGNEKMSPDVCHETGGMPAMHMSALEDDVEGVEMLLRYGADKDFKSEDGQTALDMAREKGASRVVALLSA